TLALGRALRARIETDTGHTPAGEGRLYGIDQCRFAGPVRADQRRHPAQVELLNAEQIPIDDDDAAQRDHAAPPVAGMAVSSRALRAFLSATKLSNEASVSSATTMGSAGRRKSMKLRRSSYSSNRTSPRWRKATRISRTRPISGRSRCVRSSYTSRRTSL